MNIFNDFVSALVGALLVTLSTFGASAPPATDTAASASTDTAVTTSVTAEQATALDELYANLLSIKERFSVRGNTLAENTLATERARRTEDNDVLGEPETHRSGAETAVQHTAREEEREDDSVHQNREREDDENEDEDEDDDHERRGGGVSLGTSTNTNTQTNTTSNTTTTTATFTLAQVAQHNTSASCYTVVSGSVYDVTSWISQHPGGASAIKNMCGIDASAAFNGQHGGQARPASELAGFKIGTLAR